MRSSNLKHVIAFAAAHLIGAVLKSLRDRHPDRAPRIYIAEKLSQYTIILVSLFAGLWILGIDVTSLTVFAGAVGVGLGLGLEGVVKEFFSGLVVIFDTLVHVGDFVELEAGSVADRTRLPGVDPAIVSAVARHGDEHFILLNLDALVGPVFGT